MPLVCPECDARLRPAPGRSSVRCPRCDVVVRLDAVTRDEDDRPRRPRPDTDPDERPRKRQPVVEEEDDDEPRSIRRSPSGNFLPLILGVVALVVLLVFGVGLAGYWLFIPMRPPAPPMVAGPPLLPNGQMPPVVGGPAGGPGMGGPPPMPGGGMAMMRGVEDAAWVDGSQGEALPGNGKDRPRLVLDAGGHTATVRQAMFTPDGAQLITVSQDKTVRTWDARSGEALRTLRLPVGPGDEGSINAAALSPDGTRLAVSCFPLAGVADVPVFIIDLEKNRIERTLAGHRDLVNSLDYSKDGTQLVSASGDKLARVFDVRTGEQKHVLRGHTGRLICARFSPDGTRVLTSAHDGTARVFTLKDDATEHVLKAANKLAVRGVAWSRDGTAMATCSEDGQLRLWDRAGKMTQSVDLTAENKTNVTLAAVAFTKDGSEVLYGGVIATGVVGFIDVKTGKHRLSFAKHNNSVFDVGLSADGKTAVSVGGNDHDVYVWNAEDGEVIQQIKGAGRSVWGVGWAADGSHVAFGNDNRGEQGKRPLGGTFRLGDFDVGGAPAGKYLRAVESVQTRPDRVVALKQLDFFTVEVQVNGKRFGAFKSPIQGERLYSFTLIPGERAVIGGSYATYLLDMNLDKPGTARIVRTFTGHAGLILSLAPSPDGKYFVSGSTDQTMCFWSPERDTPLLSVFVAGQEWIAWTPEGYYACSAAGERLMGWQINQGNEQLGAFHPAARFRRSLYHPNVVKDILPSGGLNAALAKAGMGQLALTSVTQVLPPEARIASPVGRTLSQANGKLTVHAEAKSVGGNAVTALRLLVNGRPYDGERGVRAMVEPKPGKVKAKWDVDLPSGQHVLTVLAESPVSRGVSESLTVTNTAADDGSPALYVLAVGVSDYEGDMKLNFAASDARAIVTAMKQHNNGAFREVDAKVLTDKQATRAGVVEGLRWLHEKMTARDVAIVFMSGHGTRDPAGNFYFVPIDVNMNDPAGTCIPGEALKKALGNLPGRVIAMFDACHSGAAAQKRVVGRTDDLTRDLVTEDYGIVCMCSSAGHEYSLESEETRAGFFTLGLVEGLAGKADFNRDKTIHLHELEFYARLRVRVLSGGRQNPTLGRPASFRSFPVAKPR